MRNIAEDQQVSTRIGDLLLEAQQVIGTDEDHNAACEKPTLRRMHSDSSNNAAETGGTPSKGDGLVRALYEHEKRIETLLMKQEERIAGKLQDLHRNICHSCNSVPAQNLVNRLPSSPRQNKNEKCISLPHQIVEATETPIIVNDLAQDVAAGHREGDDVPVNAFSRRVSNLTTKEAPEADGGESRQAESHAGLLEKMAVFSRSARKSKNTHVGMSATSPLRQMTTHLVTDRRFEMVTCTCIISNALLMGLEADFGMTQPQDDPPPFFGAANIFFIIVFTIEILLRLVAEALFFFSWHNPKFRWNMFDSMLVVSSIVEQILDSLGASANSNISIMRILRTMRVVRGFRVVRVFAFFRDLRIMVAGIMTSTASLVWAISLLVGVMFIFSVAFMQFAIAENVAQTSNDKTMATLGAKDFADLLKYFGSLPQTIYTLYLSIVGGIDWAEAASPLMKMNTFLGLLYMFYISFSVLCVLNIITGVFVENAIKRTNEDDEMVMLEQLASRKQWLQEVKVLFDDADKDGSGLICAAEFSSLMEDFRMQAWLRKLGVQVDSYSSTGLFQLLDIDEDGEINIDEFASSLQMVNGEAKSIDVAKLAKETKKVHNELKELTAVCCEFFATTMKEQHGIQFTPQTSPEHSDLRAASSDVE